MLCVPRSGPRGSPVLQTTAKNLPINPSSTPSPPRAASSHTLFSPFFWLVFVPGFYDSLNHLRPREHLPPHQPAATRATATPPPSNCPSSPLQNSRGQALGPQSKAGKEEEEEGNGLLGNRGSYSGCPGAGGLLRGAQGKSDSFTAAADVTRFHWELNQ